MKVFSGLLQASVLLAAVVWLGGCGRANNGMNAQGGDALAKAALTGSPADVLAPILGKHQIQVYNGKSTVKGTLEITVAQFQENGSNVLKAGILVRPEPGDASKLPNEDHVSTVSLTSFAKAGNVYKQKYVDPQNKDIHLDLTYTVNGAQIVIASRNCNSATCQFENFKVAAATLP